MFWLPSNHITHFFIKTLLCAAMVTMFAMYILQKVWLCSADCNLGYMSKILFTSIAFDYMILTFKVKGSVKNTIYFLQT